MAHPLFIYFFAPDGKSNSGELIRRTGVRDIYAPRSPPRAAAPRRLIALVKIDSAVNHGAAAKAADGAESNQTALIRVHLSARGINQFIEKDYIPHRALIHSDLANIICLCAPDGRAIFIPLYRSLRLLNPRSEEVYLHPAPFVFAPPPDLPPALLPVPVFGGHPTLPVKSHYRSQTPPSSRVNGLSAQP